MADVGFAALFVAVVVLLWFAISAMERLAGRWPTHFVAPRPIRLLLRTVIVGVTAYVIAVWAATLAD